MGNNRRLFPASRDKLFRYAHCASMNWTPRAFTASPAKHASKPSLGRVDVLASEREKRVRQDQAGIGCCCGHLTLLHNKNYGSDM